MEKHLAALIPLALAAGIPLQAQIAPVGVPIDTTTAILGAERIDNDQLRKGLVNNALDVLSGQAAGVNVTSNGMERMAMLNSVRVRGTTSIMGGNDPLVIIDGVTSDIQALSTIYPADIESFTILKNASETSMYGSRGASGVIEVKTRKGTGGGFQISYEGNYGFASAYKHLDMLSASEYLATASALGQYANDGGHDTNFFDAITRTAFVHNHHLAFSGGTEQQNYRASFGYINHETVIREMGYDNFVVKLDVTQKAFGDRLTGDFGIFGSSANNHDIFDNHMLFYSAACQNPTYPAGRDANGNWTKNSAASHINPPGALLHERNDQKDMGFNTHLRLTYNIMEGLELSAFGSYLYSSTENAQFCPTWVWAQGNVFRGELKKSDWLGSLSLNYEKSLGQHKIKASLGGEYMKTVTDQFFVQVKGIASNDFEYSNIGAASTRQYGGTGSSYEDHALASLAATLSYTLMDCYSLSVTTRGDGSSMVGDDHTWGFFPSVSASWDVKKEAFAKPWRNVSMLRLKTGYGQSGNLGALSAYNTMATVSQVGIVPVNNTPTVVLGTTRNNNPDLRWETKSTFNLGLDLGLWANRVVLTAEYYYSKTTDMLYAYDVPVPTFAYDKLVANIGSMENSGWEFGLSVTPIQRKDMELNINMNLSLQRNKLLSLEGNYNGMHISADNVTAMGALYGAGQNGGDNNVVYQIVGQPLGVFYLPHCTGLYLDDQGHYKYQIADLDGDGRIDLSDGGDRYIAGQATPKATLGSNISFRYKDFYVAMQVNGAFGHKVFNGTSLQYNNMSGFPDYNVLRGAPEKNIVDQNISDYWLEDGDYVNIEQLTVGYQVPMRSRVIRALRVSANVSNLCTLTGYSGLTPMVNSYVANSTLGIDDKRSYPLFRTYTLGLSVQF